MLFQIFFGIALSFIVFPGILAAEPVTFIDSPEWNNLLVVGLFNIFDTVGRALGGYKPLMIDIEKRIWLHSFAFSRVLLVALPIMVEIGVFSNFLET